MCHRNLDAASYGNLLRTVRPVVLYIWSLLRVAGAVQRELRGIHMCLPAAEGRSSVEVT
jgi:hypothetical protein